MCWKLRGFVIPTVTTKFMNKNLWTFWNAANSRETVVIIVPAFAEAEEAHVDAVSGCHVPARIRFTTFRSIKTRSISHLSKGRCPKMCATELMHQTRCRPIMYLKMFPFHATTKDSPIEQAHQTGSTKFMNKARGMYHLMRSESC